MANQLIGSSAAAIHMYQALYGQAPSNALYNSYIASIDSTSPAAFAATMAGNFTNTLDADLALMVLNNLGVTATTVTAVNTNGDSEYTLLLAALTDAFAAYPTMRGQVILNVTNLFGNLEGDATYGPAAITYNAQATADFSYASDPANTDSGVPPVSAGKTFTLNTGADTGSVFTGGAGADTFVGVVGGTTTLTAGDVLTGGSGTDTLSIAVSGAGVTTSAVVLSGIENISISNFAASGTPTFDLSQATGLAKISVTASSATGGTTITGVGNLVIAEMASGTGDLTLTYTDAAVEGDADVQTLNLTGQTAGTFTVAGATTGGIETLNISSLTAANTIVLADAGTATITTINVTGDKDLTLTGSTADAVDTINAATFTGELAITSYAAADMSITGGTANDTITFNGANFTADDTVDGGSGTDTLSIANTAAMDDGDFDGVTNVETVELVGAAAALTLAANISATTFTITDTGDQTITLQDGYTNATTINMEIGDTVDNTGANVELTINLSGADINTTTAIDGGTGTDTLNITADSDAIDATGFANIAGVDSIVIVDNGDAASGTHILGKDVNLDLGDYGTSLTIDGSALDGSTVDDEKLTVDGSGVTNGDVVLNITGGGGADSLVGGAGDDIIAGGAGKDTIDGSAGGDDSLSGGDGNDTFLMGDELTAADTIDGGSGTDILSVTDVTGAVLAGVTNVETLSISGNNTSVTLASNLSFTTIDMSTVDSSPQTLTLNSGYTSATTVSVDAGDTVTNTGANVALTVSASASDLETADSTNINSGTGTDTLNVTVGSAIATTVDTTGGLITGIDIINVVDYGDTLAKAGHNISIDLSSYATATTRLTIDASALDAGVVGAAEASSEDFAITGTASARALSVTGGAGVNTIVGSSNATLGDSLVGGGVADTFTMGANLSYLDTIAGGAGNDILAVNSGLSDVAFMHVSSIYNLAIGDSGTTTLSSYATAAGITTITGFLTAANTIDASGMTTGVTIAGATSSATDVLTGSTANDTFSFSGMTGFETADVVTGGAGTDTLKIALGTAGGTLTASLTNVATIEAITVTGITASTNIALTTADGNFVSVTGAAISFSGLTANSTVIFNASAEDDSSFVITATGGTGAETIVGGALGDTITTGSGADSITGGLGADVMTGGLGVNKYVYIGAGFETGTVSSAVIYYGGTVAAGTSVSTASLDKITDFKAGDTIVTNAGAAGANMATNATGSAWTELAGLLKGTYDATAATFTFSTTGSDSLFAYDFDGTSATNDMHAIVLVGYVDAGGTDSNTTGLFGQA